MNTNDFLGSWADENVSFATRIVKSASVGDNFWTAMVFVENSRYVNTSQTGWEKAPGTEDSQGIKVLAVDATNYANYTSGLLQSWLYDLFCNGFSGECILVACGNIASTSEDTYTPVTPVGTENPQEEGWYEETSTDVYELTTDTSVTQGKTYYTKTTVVTEDATAFIASLDIAYAALKAYAYFKTSCAGYNGLNTDVAVELSKLCGADKQLLSGAPLYPCSKIAPANDPLYAAIKASGSAQDAFMSYHSDTTRNGALYSLGLALASRNDSGTCVGSGFDAIASTNITPSGDGGTNIGENNTNLIAAHVQYFKTIGDNSLSVAAYGANTINNVVYSADWILSYITYMTKVGVARLLTSGNFLKSASNYSRIVNVLLSNILLFVGAGRLKNQAIHAPAYADLPEADSETLIIPNAWEATYVDNMRKVQITGTLYIGA
jgi:hypothetical protein